MSISVPLKRIRDNPYQPRQAYTEIEDLAQKILALENELPETLGLIHPPNVRMVDGEGNPLHFPGTLPPEDEDWAVETAEGHRRLRAFQFLARDYPAYQSMPVTILDLDDQSMDDIAWSENKDRKELSPVEEARSLKRTMDCFNLTQAALADRRKLARSTVANKLRLLQLPQDLLEAIHDGKVSERHGMAYLPVMDVKQADLKLASSTLNRSVNFMSWQTPHPDTLRRRMIDQGDLTADDVRKAVERIKREVENAKKRKWETEQRREAASSQGAATTPATSSPVPPSGPSKPAPELRPAPASEPQSLDMPPKEELVPELPDIVVTIRFGRKDGASPGAFTLSVGEEGQFPQFFRGEHDELPETLKHALDLFFPAGTEIEGEQILMEMEAQSDE